MWFRALIAALLVCASPALAQTGVQFPAGNIWGNDTAATRPGKVSTITSILDRALGSTRGSILERGASGWAIVGPGAMAGLPWVSAGTGADPSYTRLGLVGGGTSIDMTATGGTSRFLKQNTLGGTPTVTQPDFTDLAGRSTLAQLPQGIANSIWINPTGSTANMQNIAIPACAADGSHGLTYTNGTGLLCTTLTTGGTMGTVTITAGSQISTSGTCTSSSAISCTINANLTVRTRQVFLTGTNATYTTPANVKAIELWMVGGGGGGSGSSANGTAGGATCWNVTGGTACGTPLISAGGGSGSAGGGVGGIGGALSGSLTCDTAIIGGDGGGSSALALPGAQGGNSFLGGAGTGGAAGGANTGTAGKANTGGGGGGGAGVTASYQGGGAGAGCITQINTPAASYLYSVGVAGGGGAGGGAGGGTGYIKVLEYY